jgi:tetratricopeptide (TPR) repeat protein
MSMANKKEVTKITGNVEPRLPKKEKNLYKVLGKFAEQEQSKEVSWKEWLQQLSVKKITKEQLFEFLGQKKEPTGEYMVSPDSISGLGFFLTDEKDPELKKLEVKLYKLSADRCSAVGAYNFAQALLYGSSIPKNIKKASIYARKSIDGGFDAYFLRAEVLREQKKYSDAIENYLKINDDDDLNLAAKAINEISPFILKPKDAKYDYSCLFHEIDNLSSQYGEPRSKLHYLVGLAHYYRGDYKNAMLDFLKIPTDSAWYDCTTNFKKDCYLKTGRAILGIQDDGTVEEKKEEKEEDAAVQAPLVIDLPDGIAGKINFGAAWKKDNLEFFSDAVNVSMLEQIKNAWQKMLNLTKKTIEARRELVHKVWEHVSELIPTLEGLDEADENLEKEEESLKSQQKKLDKITEYMPTYRRKLRRAKSEERYFSPMKAKPEKKLEIWNIYEEILSARFGDGAGIVSLNGHNARQVYRAEQLFQEIGIKFFTAGNCVDLGMPPVTHKRAGKSDLSEFGPKEHWQAGVVVAGKTPEVEVAHAIAPSRKRPGKIYMFGLPKHETYNDILSFLNTITGHDPNKEKELARYMIRYAREFKPITFAELQAIKPTATEKMVNQFHTICLHVCVKEQTQFLSNKDERYKAGLAVVQARCLILLREGYLTFKDVFKRKAEFGVFSQVDLLGNFGEVEAAIEKIEKLYMEHIKLARHKEYATFFAKNPNHEMVLTRKQARADLCEVYGGAESDSEDDGYETDMSYGGGL